MVATVLTACSSTAAPRTDLLEARAFRGRLVLENRTDEPVYYFAIEHRSSTLVDWMICKELACPSVPAGGTISIPYSEIAGYERSATQVVIHHWRLIPGAIAGELAATDLRFLRVRLH